jgi:hypothetical protein
MQRNLQSTGLQRGSVVALINILPSTNPEKDRRTALDVALELKSQVKADGTAHSCAQPGTFNGYVFLSLSFPPSLPLSGLKRYLRECYLDHASCFIVFALPGRLRTPSLASWSAQAHVPARL